jgi:hypothetical protein
MSLPSSTSSVRRNLSIGSFFSPKSRKPNEKMATEFMARYDKEGENVVDWVELSQDVEEMTTKLKEYSNSMNINELVTVFSEEEKRDAVEMDQLHSRSTAAELTICLHRGFVKNDEEARRYGDAKMIELQSKGDFTGRMQFIRMRNAADKVLKCAEPILQKEKEQLESRFSNSPSNQRMDGMIESVSPLTECGDATHPLTCLLAPTSKDDDPSVQAWSVVNLHQEQDSVKTVDTASATPSTKNPIQSDHQSALTGDLEGSVASAVATTMDSSVTPDGDLDDNEIPPLGRFFPEDDDDDDDEEEEPCCSEHSKFPKAELHASVRPRKIRKRPDGSQMQKERKRPKIILTRAMLVHAKKKDL